MEPILTKYAERKINPKYYSVIRITDNGIETRDATEKDFEQDNGRKSRLY